MKLLSFIELSKANLLHNLSEVRKRLPQHSSLTAVVKANAYGHGLEEVVKIAEKKVDAFQVDDIDELRRIRKITQKPVLVLGFVQQSDLKEFVKLDAVLGVYNIETIQVLDLEAKKQNKTARVHLKIDAFLGRQGVLRESLPEIIIALKKSKHLKIESVYSHFSDIEDVTNLTHAKKQHKELLSAKQILKENGFEDITHHISATSGFLSDIDENWGGVMVRFGIGMYGLWPSEALKRAYADKINLKPVMRWVSHLAQIKEVPKDFPIGYGQTYRTKKRMKIGIVPQGYSDGFDRAFSNKGYVLVSGKKCPVIGRVAMNMFAINLTSVPATSFEDEVVLLGTQKTNEIKAEDLASLIETINYEIIARISPLLPKKVV